MPDNYLQAAVEIARQAGQILREEFARPVNISYKGDEVDLVTQAARQGKVVAAICHGPSAIIEAGAARGRKIASWPSLKTDLRNAGAEWIDKEAVTDGNLVTARKPEDIPAFNRAVIELFSAGVQQKRPAA